MSEFLHMTKNGDEIALKDLSDGHLKNIIAWLEKKADEGVTLRNGGGCMQDPDSMWYDEQIVQGEEALRSLGYYEYDAECKRRAF